jgi:RimJ/RimL family protein N-acetyltransferase
MRDDEAHLVVDYFHSRSPEDLATMGVDPVKIPEAAAWNARLREDFAQPVGERRWHFVVWEIDGNTVGHSNIGDLVRGQHGTMHLHLWRTEMRAQGHGTALVLASVARYFEVLDIDRIYCQPNAFNVAPNRVLFRAGFEYLETVETVPGFLNYRQPVTRWRVTRGMAENTPPTLGKKQ